MKDAVEGWTVCTLHTDPAACPDALIARRRDGTYGIRIHDGGSSAISIRFCPFCGVALGGGEEE